VHPSHVFEATNGRTPPSAHNRYLDVWFQLGLVGALLFAALVIVTLTL
jgi:O-antigen ligase